MFHGSLQPVFAVQIHHDATLVKPVMAVCKICLYHKAEIFFFCLRLQDRGIVIPEIITFMQSVNTFEKIAKSY